MIITGDALEELKRLETESVHCCVTSPPYWGLRRYYDKVEIDSDIPPDKMKEIYQEMDRLGVPYESSES